MILKICRKKIKENEKEGTTQIITEYYNGNSFKMTNDSDIVIDDKECVFIADFGKADKITGDIIKYETTFAYIMNNDGKTIERLL